MIALTEVVPVGGSFSLYISEHQVYLGSIPLNVYITRKGKHVFLGFQISDQQVPSIGPRSLYQSILLRSSIAILIDATVILNKNGDGMAKVMGV